jgi:hypothetical protein
MTWRQALAAMVLLTVPWPTRADAEIEKFFGQWRGVEVNVESADPAPKLAPADLDMTITEENSGFRVRALGLSREPDGSLVPRPIEAIFAPTEIPGVFAFEPDAGGLLSRLFADPSVGNPLQGETLLWARVAADTLHLYSLAIDPRGGYALGQSIAELSADGMVTRYELRLENDHIVTVEGRLERAGN